MTPSVTCPDCEKTVEQPNDHVFCPDCGTKLPVEVNYKSPVVSEDEDDGE